MIVKRQIRTGIVPIFDGRSTNEPITFTFTPIPPSNSYTDSPSIEWQPNKNYPTLTPKIYDGDYHYLNGHVNGERYNDKDLDYKHTTPMYNQVQYYRAMQSAINQNVNQEYQSIFSQLGATWSQLKSDVVSAGVERDWRSLWEKLTGTVEPYLSVFGEQIGRLANTFIRQQQLRYKHHQELQKNLVQRPGARHRHPRMPLKHSTENATKIEAN